MKKTKLFGWAFVATMMSTGITACSNDAEEVLVQESEIKLTSEITPSRVADFDYQSTQIVEGQQVGVTITGAKSEHNNVAWSVSEDGTLTNTGDAIYFGDGTATITAYHPFNDDWDENTSYAFSVSTDQSTDAEYLASDLLWAKETSQKTETAIPLTFAHKLAKINVTLVPEEDDGDLNGATISICNTKISTTFNPTTGEISDGTGEAQEIIAGVTADDVYTVSAIVIPQEVSGKFIKITHEGKTYYYTLASAKTLETGTSYSYTLTVKGKQLISTGSSINPWNPDSEEGVDGDAEEDVSKLIVTLSEAGTLSNYLNDANKDVIEELKIIGNINGTDIQVIRDISQKKYSASIPNGILSVLDLSEANIVSGGNSYKPIRPEEEVYTQDNIVTAGMFGYTNLKTIILPSNITEIGERAFEVVWNMESIVIPEGVTKLGASSFNTSIKLKSITIPESVVEIGGNSFNECAFTEITLPSKLKVINEDTFMICCNLKTINLPAELEEIRMGAFCGCESLESLTIPSSIKKLNYAFQVLENLKEIHCNAQTPPALQYNTSNSALVNCTIYVPSDAVDEYKAATGWKNLNIEAES